LRFIDPTGLEATLGSIGISNPGGVNYSPSISVGGPAPSGPSGPSSGPSTHEGADLNGRTKDEYDKNGFLKKRTMYDDKGNVVNETDYKDGFIRSTTDYTYTGKNSRTINTYYYEDSGHTEITKEQIKTMLGWVTQSATYYRTVSQVTDAFTLQYSIFIKNYKDSTGSWVLSQTTDFNFAINNNDAGQLFAEHLTNLQQKAEGLPGLVAGYIKDVGNYIGLFSYLAGSASYFMKGDTFSYHEEVSNYGFGATFNSWEHYRKDDKGMRLIDNYKHNEIDYTTRLWLKWAFGL